MYEEEGRREEFKKKSRRKKGEAALLNVLRTCHANDVRLQDHSEAFNPARGIDNEWGQRVAMPAGGSSCCR
jgi:hypothetical protein